MPAPNDFAVIAPLDDLGLRLLLALGLSLFLGLAFAEFYDEAPRLPGGVRTFPLLTFVGIALYLCDPLRIAYAVGLAVLGAWLFAYYRSTLETPADATGGTHTTAARGEILMLVFNVAAYALGPIALTQPTWFAVGFAVFAALLLTGRDALYGAVKKFDVAEVSTAGRFLILVGVVLPLLANRPAFPGTELTPFKVWLAVVAVSTLSYVSYLMQRYVFPNGGVLITSILGGLYSSTATTVVLARKARDEGMRHDIEAGIIAATAMMYPRLLLVTGVFNGALAEKIAPSFLSIAALLVAIAWWRYRLNDAKGVPPARASFGNPLQIGTALIFAFLLVAISLISTWVQNEAGRNGILALAGVVGFTDIDPFVLSLAQSGAAHVGLVTAAVAIAIATASNNVLKAVYTIAFSRLRASIVPAGVLVIGALAGIGAALVLAR